MDKQTILTVCSGNMFRSPVAAFCLHRALTEAGAGDSIEVTSRGIQGLGVTKDDPVKRTNLMEYPLEWGYSEPEFIRWGIDITSHRSTVVTEKILVAATLVLAMDWGILYSRPNSLVRLFPSYAWKMRLFSEIAGQFQGIEDIFKVNEPGPYTKAIELIDGIARRGTGYIKQWIANIQDQTQNQKGEQQ